MKEPLQNESDTAMLLTVKAMIFGAEALSNTTLTTSSFSTLKTILVRLGPR